MIDSLNHRGGHYLLLAVIGMSVFFLNLGGPTLWEVDEGRNIACSLAMMESGNWIVPTFNGSLRTDKPALLYWLQIFSYLTFGVNEFAGRFPSALAAFGTVLLTYELARSMFTRMTGLLAAVIVATTPMLIGAGRFANPDALLNCCTVLTLTIFWLGLGQRRWWWFPLLGVASGLAVLAKGPVGLVLPGAACTLFLLWEGEWRLGWDRRWLATFWAFVLTALPWYVWVGIETHGEFLSGFLLTHNLQRGMSAMDTHHGFPGYYLVVLFVGTMPWSIFLAAACWFGFWSAIRCPWTFWQAWWAKASEVGAAEKSAGLTDMPAAYRLLFCWIAVFVVFFSVAATKLPNYVLPAVVPCAILVARLLQRWRTETLRLPGWLLTSAIVGWSLFGILVTTALAIVGGVGKLPGLRGHFFPGLELWALLGLIPIAASIVGWWLVRQRQYGRFVVIFAAAALLVQAPMAAFGSVLFNRFKAPAPLVEQAHLLRRGEDIRIGCFQMEHMPSVVFYVQREIEFLDHDPDVPRFLSYRLPAYIIMPARDWQRLEGSLHGAGRVVGQHYDMYHHEEMVVVTNQ